jgi:gp32 DNA binding protein like
MSSLSNLKKSSSLEKLTKALQETTKNKSDDRFWQPEVDKAGNGYAIIRFLDAPHVDGDEGLPFVQLFTHGFQGPGGWYIENSLTTLGESDPVSDYNSKLWNSGVEANKEIARKQKRQLNYISNILIVKDPAHPENEGKVFLYRYGKKIFDKIKEKLEPQFEDEKRINPFNFWEGANFKLKIRKVEGYRNYDKSEFEPPSPIADSDEKIEKLWKGSYSLKELVDKKNFKSYDVLKARLDKTLGADGRPTPNTTAETTSAAEVTTTVADVDTAEVVDDPDMDVFRRLAE